MKLPNRKQLEIAKNKLIYYLLSDTHPTGRFKARFFKSLGYDENNMEVLENHIQNIAKNDVISTTSTA